MIEETNMEYRWLEPFKSMEELEEAVSSLEHWAIPGELPKYLEILYRLTAFDISERFEIRDVEYGGISGSFVGHYSDNVRDAAREICSSKFPTDVWDYSENGLSRLKENYPKGVGYLANYAASPVGLNAICERTNFKYDFATNYHCYGLKDHTTLEEVQLLEQSATNYLARSKKTTK